MILGFRVSNYRSFRDEAVLDMSATRLDEGVGHSLVIAADGQTKDILPVAAILGSNASGKSNILKAMAFMKDFVVGSLQLGPDSPVPRDPFRFDASSLEGPSLFEIEFEQNGGRYTYGFELGSAGILGEWLFTYPHKRAQLVFERDGNDFQPGKMLGGARSRSVHEVLRSNTLFLPAMAHAKVPALQDIYSFFQHRLTYLAAEDRSHVDQRDLQRLKRRRREILALASMADLGIREASISEVPREPSELLFIRDSLLRSLPEDMPEDEKEGQVEHMIEMYVHNGEALELIHRSAGGGAPLPFEEESLGTRSWLTFLIDAMDTLRVGGTLIVDELDLSLHPSLVREALGLFQNSRSNRQHGQLIFSTHDATLLGKTHEGLNLSRGQVWFCEKNGHGESVLFPLSDYKPRKGEDLEKGYLQGRYGGVPQVRKGALSGALERGEG